jgi:hypothetical protein
MQGYRVKPAARWSNRRLTFNSKAIIIAAMFGQTIVVADNANDNNDEA